MNRILLLEDDISLIDGLAFTLHKNNFEIVVARTVRDAITALSEQTFDLLLLDLTLPDGSGFEVCKKARLTSNVPILFLTASDEEVNVVMGLDMGGDDYITKPFKLNELISRINALLRRAGMAKTPPAELQSNGITVKLEENRVLKDGAPLGRKSRHLFRLPPNDCPNHTGFPDRGCFCVRLCPGYRAHQYFKHYQYHADERVRQNEVYRCDARSRYVGQTAS